ncbi:response regulator transcription factor [Anaerococcus sp. NML200574]|uniref:response regulator transcription factor n=1 Tax=Anaerococcus sp. NML200574 TaxID=2954486 RepID=UPI002238E44E|nr:response regulator transcription factor [Anaerococcus sp. NML200574]MCW6678710.1 response regulator transcription factor [Anaerococcus sp. NML200574]
MKIILLDDHKIFGESLSRLLEEKSEISVCSYTNDVSKLFKLLDENIYDICLIDLSLNNSNSGFDVLKRLNNENNCIKKVILSSYNNPIYKNNAYKLGADAYFTKSIDVDFLLENLKLICDGKYNRVDNLYKDLLTRREKEVLKEIIKGKKNSDIAKELFISERTLYHHIESIYDKLKVDNKVDLYSKAIELGYIEPII